MQFILERLLFIYIFVCVLSVYVMDTVFQFIPKRLLFIFVPWLAVPIKNVVYFFGRLFSLKAYVCIYMLRLLTDMTLSALNAVTDSDLDMETMSSHHQDRSTVHVSKRLKLEVNSGRWL